MINSMILLKKIIICLILFLLTLLPILISVAYIILAERKVMASIQRRRGPNVVGFFGLLQPFIDAVKLLTKEHIYPNKSNIFLFCIGPFLTLIIAIINWSFIPFNYDNYYFDYKYSLLLILVFSSISTYGIVISGWASNSKYASMGAIRIISQFISYELILSLSLLPIICICGSLNLIDIVFWQANSIWFIVPFWPLAYIFFISMLAETNRTPFDLPEAEAELVAGYNVEYSSVFFILFMFAEYSNLLLMSALFCILFLGGWDFVIFSNELVFSIKFVIISFLFIVVRATQPRYRFDQLMTFAWKILLPLVFCLFFLYICLYIAICFLIPESLFDVLNYFFFNFDYIFMLLVILVLIFETFISNFYYKLRSQKNYSLSKIFLFILFFCIICILDELITCFIFDNFFMLFFIIFFNFLDQLFFAFFIYALFYEWKNEPNKYLYFWEHILLFFLSVCLTFLIFLYFEYELYYIIRFILLPCYSEGYVKNFIFIDGLI